MNRGEVEVTVEAFELKYGASGKQYGNLNATFEATQKDKSLLKVPFRAVAFGAHADRLATTKPGDKVVVEYELGGNEYQGKTYINYIVRHVYKCAPWSGSRQEEPAKRAVAGDRIMDDDGPSPF